MEYRKNSNWNDEAELRCLLVFKQLQAENFPRGKQVKYCQELSRLTKLSVGSISAKICNYKSVAGVNNKSNASTATKKVFKTYGHLSIPELEQIIDSETQKHQNLD